jgi:hypothetical protein
MSSNQLHSRPLLFSGVLIAFAAVAGIAFHAGRVSSAPARASIILPAAAQAPAPAGFVCRSSHYTLTAEVHAGS